MLLQCSFERIFLAQRRDYVENDCTEEWDTPGFGLAVLGIAGLVTVGRRCFMHET